MPHNVYCSKCGSRVTVVAAQAECRCQSFDCGHVQRLRVVTAGEMARLLAPIREEIRRARAQQGVAR